MKSLIFLFLSLLYTSFARGQNSFIAFVKDEETKEPLIGATVLIQGTSYGSSTDHEGKVQINNIPDGKWVLVFRFVGYMEKADTFNFPNKAAADAFKNSDAYRRAAGIR